MAAAIENAWLVKEMEEGYLGLVVGLIGAAEEARPQARSHSGRVTELACAVARAMGLEEPRVELLRRAAALHGVGRLLAPAAKGGKGRGSARGLTVWSTEAALSTERTLVPIASLRAVRGIILHSAERFDAAPVRLGPEQVDISTETHILAACEEYARLTHGKPGDPKTSRQALETLRKAAGGRFDAEVVEALGGLVQGAEAS